MIDPCGISWLRNALGEGCFDLIAGLERAEHGYRLNRSQREFRWNVVSNAGETDDADFEFLSRFSYGFQIRAADVAQPDF